MNDERSSGLAQDLAALITAKPASPADLEKTALYVLDAVANIIAGTNSAPGKIFLDWARDYGCLSQTGEPGRHALVLGALCHILEMDDLHRGSVVHPGCVVVPAVLALARFDRTRASDGTLALRAILCGFEATTRVGGAVGPEHYRIWHNTATCGPFGSAMASAVWLGLDQDASADAIANAGTQSAGLWQFLDTGAMSKHLHAGRAAEAGVVAATLAARGLTGAPEIFEGKRGFFAAMCPDGEPRRIVADPGAPWQVHETSIKPWPSCRHTHPAIDAAIEIRAMMIARGKTLADVTSIDVGAYSAALDLCDNADPQSTYEAKFSLQHCIAAALMREEVNFAAFDAPARTLLAECRSKVSVSIVPDVEHAYPAHWGCTLQVETSGGAIMEVRRDDAAGDPEAPLSRERLIEKARMLMRHGGHADCDRLIEGILDMPNGGPVPEIPV